MEVARARGSSMEELLKYDITPTSSLFDKEGLMRKAVKSSLVQELEQSLAVHQASATKDDFHTTYLVDMMANVRKLRTKDLNTFGEFCGAALNYVQKSANDANRTDLIFDSYTGKSIKDSERRRRQITRPIELSTINTGTPRLVKPELA